MKNTTMMQEIILHQISHQELLDSIRAVVQEELETSKTETLSSKEYLTRQEVADLCKVSLTTIHTWTKDGRLKSVKIGGRVLYKTSDVLSSLEDNKLKKWAHDQGLKK